MRKILKVQSGRVIAQCTFVALQPLISMFLISCTSQIPVATNYPYTEQQKMQAPHHWDVVAAEVVRQLEQSGKISKSMPLFVAARSERFIAVPFERAYHNFLITELVNAGYNVVERDEAAAVRVSFDVQMVKHNDRRVRGPHLISTLGRVLAGSLDGAYEGIDATKCELIVTTSVRHGSIYVMRRTDTYYVDRPPWDSNYTMPPKVVEVVDR